MEERSLPDGWASFLESGLDSSSLATVVIRLGDSLGIDPFESGSTIEFPVTFGDFVRVYARRWQCPGSRHSIYDRGSLVQQREFAPCSDRGGADRARAVTRRGPLDVVQSKRSDFHYWRSLLLECPSYRARLRVARNGRVSSG